MDWWIFAVLASTAAVQAFAAAAWVVIGGLGGQWRVNQALSRQAQELLRLDERLTRDQKTRAGERSQEAQRAAKSIEQDAAERLAAASAPTSSSGRPSTMRTINGGG